LDISRIESGRAELNFSSCNIARLLDDVIDLLMPQIKSKNINWVSEIDQSIPEIIIDTSQIERVFINLISNAIKFTPEEGTITVKIYMGDHFLNVEVSDTGIGISESDTVKLFDEFYRVENEINQNLKGTGLGLALVKKIIEAHNGKIWVKSAVGQGTTFYFTLPPKPVEFKNNQV
jgi:two-component system phosphate regulon sensor histidine kinase PhoR